MRVEQIIFPTGERLPMLLDDDDLPVPQALELDEPNPPKKEICSSRMFGQRLTDVAPIKEAVSTYASRAAEKLRAQESLCKRIRVSIRTGMFNPDEAKCANGVLV